MCKKKRINVVIRVQQIVLFSIKNVVDLLCMIKSLLLFGFKTPPEPPALRGRAQATKTDIVMIYYLTICERLLLIYDLKMLYLSVKSDASRWECARHTIHP